MNLFRNRNFNIFLAVQALSVAGDSFSTVAIPLLVLHATGSVVQMGLLTGLSGAASLVTGVFAGHLVDRVDRRRLLIGCDLARAALYAAIPLVWMAGPQIWLLYVIVPLGAALGMVFQVAYVAVVPSLVEPDQITQANGRLYAIYAVGGIGGPALVGVISQAFGPVVAIGMDAVTFVVSALGLMLIRLRPAAAAPADRGGLLEGARFLWRHPVMRSLTILLTFFIFLTAGVDDVLIYHLKHDLGQNDDAVGLVLACAAVGAIVGAPLIGRIRKAIGFGNTWVSATTLSGLAMGGVGLATGVPAVAVLMALFVLGTAVAGICSQSFRQEVTPSHLLGRVTAAFWTVHYVLGPAGAALLTLGAAEYGVATVTVVAGAGCVLVSLSGLLTPMRRPLPPS
ncbi:MFS transporter [Nonomuraea ceibae]|uniref:MFS transporter n=1 Tax=Nonomuraea ceibae TaxID=1935170 RepID=UPI001C5D0CEE|nr:MFS transporter [Nonomuraea ceibae]